MRLSIIVPTLNEAAGIAGTLESLAPLRARGHEVIVVDGGSTDATPELARPLADRLLSALRGRATQMNAGAAAATGDVLLFLHADTRLPRDADVRVTEALARPDRVWGRFDVEIAGRHPLLRAVAWLMNRRSRATGIATGDQAMFVKRSAFERVGGFPPLELMEDLAMSKALKRLAPPVFIDERAVTSGRRWEKNGVVRTILLMWWLRLRFWLGASTARLRRTYEGP